MKHLATIGVSLFFTLAFGNAITLPAKAAATETVKVIRPSHLKANQTTRFDLVLKPRHASEEFTDALAVNTPGNPQFKQFITPTEFRQRYGQPTSVTDAWTTFLNRHDLKTHVYSDGLLITVAGKAQAIANLFKVNLAKAHYHKDVLQFGSQKPSIPQSLAQSVRAVVGITDHNPNNVISDSQSGLSGSTEGLKNFEKNLGTTKHFTVPYHVTGLYQKGMTGKGQTIGLITFEGFTKSNVIHFWKHEGANANPQRLSVKKIRTATYNSKFTSSTDSLEPTLDTEYAGSIAPQAKVNVFESNTGVPSLMTFLNAYATVYDENQVSVVSTSWSLGSVLGLRYLQQHGILPSHYQDLLSTLLAQGALQGISTFIGSGDQGAKPSYLKQVSHGKAILAHSLNAGDALASNPWLTSVGGTSQPHSFQIMLKNRPAITVAVTAERSWGSDANIPSLEKLPKALRKHTSFYVGSGGGFSTLYPTPSYQNNVPGVNTFNAYPFVAPNGHINYHPALISGTGSGRNFPDLATNADPQSGYFVYQKSASKSGWIGGGSGTSISSPQVAAVATLINSAPNHARMGFWNPQIYQLAQRADSPFTPLNGIVNNSNTYYTGQPGAVYNQATGLGVPNFDKLAQLYQ